MRVLRCIICCLALALTGCGSPEEIEPSDARRCILSGKYDLVAVTDDLASIQNRNMKLVFRFDPADRHAVAAELSRACAEARAQGVDVAFETAFTSP